MRVPEQMVLYVSPSMRLLRLADVIFSSKERLGQFDAGDLTVPARRIAAAIAGHPVHRCPRGLVSGLAVTNYFCSHPAISSRPHPLLRDNHRPGAEHGRPLASRSGWFVAESTGTIPKGFEHEGDPAACGLVARAGPRR